MSHSAKVSVCTARAASTSVFKLDSGSRLLPKQRKCQDVLWCKAHFQDNGEMPYEEEAECWDGTVVLFGRDILKLWYCVSLMQSKFGTGGAVVLCKVDVLAPH